MTLKSHNGAWSKGDVLVYKSYSGSTFNGVKVLKDVWIDEISDYQYIVQLGSVKENEWIPSNGGKSLAIYPSKEITSGYDQKWTKDTLAPVKGDILAGFDKDGTRVLVLFEASYSCHRLNKRAGASQDQSSAPFEYYQLNLTDLAVLKNTNNGLPFSQI